MTLLVLSLRSRSAVNECRTQSVTIWPCSASSPERAVPQPPPPRMVMAAISTQKTDELGANETFRRSSALQSLTHDSDFFFPNRDSVPFKRRVIFVRCLHTARPPARIENRIRTQKLLLPTQGLIKTRLTGKEIAAQIEASETYLLK